MTITIGSTTVETTTDQDDGLAFAAGDQDPAAYLVHRVQEVLDSYSQQKIDADAEALKQAFITATPDQRQSIITANQTAVVSPIGPVGPIRQVN